MMTAPERASDSDSDSVDAIRHGDRAAFERLVKKYQRMVEAVAYSKCGQRALVDDIVQDTFVIAWRTIDQLRDATRVRPWLYGIARNVACNARRRREPQIDALPGSKTPFDDVSERERDREIANALARLPASYREPLVLFYYEQCTVKEVAEALAVAEDAALQRLSRGRRKLGEELATKVELELERRPSRAALASCVLALLPVRAATASTIPGTTPASLRSAPASPMSVPARPMPAPATPSRWQTFAGALAARKRLVGGAVACSLGAAIVILGSQRSEQIARADARRATMELDDTARTASPPRLPEPQAERTERDDSPVHRNISVASDDAAETCARGARGLVLWVLGQDAFQFHDGQIYFRPSPELERTADAVAARAAETCRGLRWPELHVMCEATEAEIEDGDVGCFPYDPLGPS